MFLDEVKNDDKRIADAWKEDSNGILVFVSPNLLTLFVSMTSSKTGLFSVIVGAFIIEFYKTLSPDSGNQTVVLLGQLANFPNGTYSNTANQPFSPSASMIWVNAMWLISFVLSLASALVTTLLQQSARGYLETSYPPSDPNHRARVRSFLFLGTEFYKTRFPVRMAPTLLHFSVFLFFVGLVVLFHTINKNVAIALDVSVGVFALAYIALSILPCLDLACPYRTPMSYILWYPLHTILSFAALFLRWFAEVLHGCLVQPNLDYENATSSQRILVRWLNSGEYAFKTHWQYVTDGPGKSLINRAINTQGDGDRKIVARLFNLVLGDKSKLQKLVASIPRDKVLELIPLIESGRIVLREPLAILLRSCTTGTHAAGPDEDVRRRSLLICLDAIHYIAKTPRIPDLNFVRTNFANVGLMRGLWNDSDTAIRFTSRSICALLAKQVVSEPLEEPQLRWLQDVTGEAPHVILNASFDIVTRNRMNFKSFVYGVLSSPVGDFPTDDSFKETLAILLDVGTDVNFERDHSRGQLIDQVEWVQQDDPQDSREVVDKLRSMFPFLSPPFPTPTSPPPPFLSHYDVPFVDSNLVHYHSTIPLPDSRVPFPTQLTHSLTSNVPRGGNVQSLSTPPPL